MSAASAPADTSKAVTAAIPDFDLMMRLPAARSPDERIEIREQRLSNGIGCSPQVT
jgi:hypothetical protein